MKDEFDKYTMELDLGDLPKKKVILADYNDKQNNKQNNKQNIKSKEKKDEEGVSIKDVLTMDMFSSSRPKPKI